MKSLCIFVTMLATLLGAPCLFASTSYVMGYTPAGGVTVAPGGGAPYTSSPALYAYSNFNDSAYQTLYYGVNYVANVAQTGSPTGNMAFQGVLANGSLAWGSTANWVFNSGFCGTVSTPTQFMAQIQPYTGAAGFLGSGLNGETTTKGALGITSGGAGDPLFQVVSAGNFQVTFQFLTWDGNPSNLGTGTDLQDYFANCNGGSGGEFQTSVDFEFWWNIAKTSAKVVQVGGCKTAMQSYANIQTALAAVPAGATIQICPGTYNEQLTITAPITLQGLTFGTSQSVILGPPGVFESNGALGETPIFAQILVQDAGPVNISGLTIDGNNSGCPAGAVVGVVYLSASNPASGKLFNSVIRNTGNGCSPPAVVGFYAQNGSGSASTLTVQGNSIHSINGGGIIFGPNVGGTIVSNTIDQVTGGLMFQQAGPAVKVSANNLISTQNAISLNSATGVVAQGNQIVNTSGTAISLQDTSSGGSNNVTKNTVNEANCGISSGNAAASDVFLPNTVLNATATTCH